MEGDKSVTLSSSMQSKDCRCRILLILTVLQSVAKTVPIRFAPVIGFLQENIFKIISMRTQFISGPDSSYCPTCCLKGPVLPKDPFYLSKGTDNRFGPPCGLIDPTR
jgi:hypothetical protein